LSEDVVLNKAKGELRILGERHVAVDAQALCEHLNAMTGTRVAEVLMNQHESRLGKEDAARIRERENPQASVQEVIDLLIDAECLSGVGIVKLTVPENLVGPISLEISNPCVKGTLGVAKALLISYWCGALTYLLGKEFEATHVIYDEGANLIKCRIVPRSIE